MVGIMNRLQDLMDALRKLDFLAPLALRIYLVPVFWIAGTNKWNPFDGTLNPAEGLAGVASWFGEGLGLPFPLLMAFFAWGAEFFGAVLLALGLATRWIAIPLIFTMVVAAGTVHWENGWQAVHDPSSPYPAADIEEVMERQSLGRQIMEENGHPDWLFERGNFVISNNGIEWSVTYLIMLLALWALGGGKYVSLDYYIKRRFRDKDRLDQ